MNTTARWYEKFELLQEDKINGRKSASLDDIHDNGRAVVST
jgi:hypothetical protein